MSNKLLLILCLGTFPLIANAEWIQYAKSTKSSFEIYYSSASIKTDGWYKTVTILKNFNEPQEFTAEKPFFKFLSSVETQSIDCEKKVYRGTRTEKWSELWGKGKLGKSYDYVGAKKQAWSEPIKITQIEGVLMEKVCPQ